MKTESEMDFTNRMKEYIDLSKIETKEELEEILRTTLDPDGKNKQPSTKQINILLPDIGITVFTSNVQHEDYFFTMVKFQYGERKVKRDRFGRFSK